LRTHAVPERTTPRYGEPAAWRRAPHRRIPAARSATQGRTEAALGICGAGDCARTRPRPRARVGAVIATSGTRRTGGVASHLAGKGRTATYAPRETIRRIAKQLSRQSLEHEQGARNRSAPRRDHLRRCGGVCGVAGALSSFGFRYSALGLRDAFWRRWRRTTIAARDRAARLSRSDGNRSSRQSNTIASISIMRYRSATPHCCCFPR